MVAKVIVQSAIVVVIQWFCCA